LQLLVLKSLSQRGLLYVKARTQLLVKFHLNKDAFCPQLSHQREYAMDGVPIDVWGLVLIDDAEHRLPRAALL
jgi:hypothetical protein